MTPQLFWHSVTGTGFWGVCWEDFSPTTLLPHWWGHISYAGAPELWGVPVSAAKCPWSHLGSKGSTMVQNIAQQMAAYMGGSLAVPPWYISMQSFPQTVCCSSRPSASPEEGYVLCLQHRFLSLLSPASCPSIWWSSHTSTVSPAHFQIHLFSHCCYVPLPKACARPSVVLQVWLYHQSWQILPYISPRLRFPQKLSWNPETIWFCAFAFISVYLPIFVLQETKFAGLLLIL